MAEPALSPLLGAVREAAAAAAREIMRVYATEFEVELKRDASLVTSADRAADAALRASLPALEPVPVISEETEAPPFAVRREYERLWLVDPLDGTQGFVSRSGDFAVNVALVEAGRPVLGLVLAPVREVCYAAEAGAGAFKIEGSGSPRPIRTRRPLQLPATVATSRSRRNSRTAAFIDALGPGTVLRVGSAIKSCLVAEGAADVYPGFSPTSEWDTAAAQVILEEAGGALVDESGAPLRYNARVVLTNPAFLAVGDPAFDWTARLPGRQAS